MILTHFSKVCAYALGFFLFGLAALLLVTVFDLVKTYNESLLYALLLSFYSLLFCIVAFVAFSLFLTIERRAIENERFRKSGVELLPPIGESKNFSRVKSMDLPDRILDAYNDLLRQDEIPSLSKIAILVFGQKGGAYTNQVKEVLASEEIFL